MPASAWKQNRWGQGRMYMYYFNVKKIITAGRPASSADLEKKIESGPSGIKTNIERAVRHHEWTCEKTQKKMRAVRHQDLVTAKKATSIARHQFALVAVGPTPLLTPEPCRRRCVRPKRTNLRVKGLSLNRSQKRSALLSTTPRLRSRSSTSDLAPPRRARLLSSLRHACALVGARLIAVSCRGFATAGAEIGRPASIFASRRGRRLQHRRISGRDSDLEAFSHNPSDGSLAPSAYRPSTRTKCPNLRFLSY